ncbi:molecular chaperone [Pantoea dispersa]|uniref:fimbrial biogenesis chaperone n=1 Tax=Pantoea dispersa TaxID=59814 RepID=UPI0039B51113
MRSLYSLLPLFFIYPASCLAAEDKGGFSLGATRVIYNENHKEASFTVINTAENVSFLAQSWVSPYKEGVNNTKPPFIITPPLYRQDVGKNTLRIVRSGGDLPTDRESAFWLNVKAIPSSVKPTEKSNSLSFAYVLRIKLFYRPVGIKGDASNAYKQLTFSRQGDKLIASNPTPYHITLNKVSIGGKEIKDVTAMVPPLSEQSYKLPASGVGSKVIYKAVNDMGGITTEQIKSL